MIDSLIANPNGFYDDLCNQIILYSSTVSKELGMSYSELWIGIMIGIFLLFIWYNILFLFNLYSPYKKATNWIVDQANNVNRPEYSAFGNTCANGACNAIIPF